MTAPAPLARRSPTRAEAGSPQEPRPKRMFAWLVALPAALLLLAFAGANWRVFHLAYCKGLMRSSDAGKRGRGIAMAANVHLRTGMTPGEVKRVFHPVKVEGGGRWGKDIRYDVRGPLVIDDAICAGGIDLRFGEDRRLVRWVFVLDVRG